MGHLSANSSAPGAAERLLNMALFLYEAVNMSINKIDLFNFKQCPFSEFNSHFSKDVFR